MGTGGEGSCEGVGGAAVQPNSVGGVGGGGRGGTHTHAHTHTHTHTHHYTQKDYRTELYYFRIIFGNSCSVITEPNCFWNY